MSCLHCERRNRRVETRRAISALYLTGAPIAEIAQAIGRTPGSTAGEIGHMRADGWDLPYRLPPRVRFYCPGCGERLVDPDRGCGFCLAEAAA